MARSAAAGQDPRVRLLRLPSGRVVTGFRHRAPRSLRVGVVFQQPRLSADPRLRLRDLVAEPLRATGRRSEVDSIVPELADRVALSGDLLARRPREVSDGQLQRACLARAGARSRLAGE